ncbi:peptide chain release factor H, partial [Salmonella enterica subsp. enterica serovar Enteritidis]|nr:peptide chain release factor H [Salmonella enterica subsp. enterica serovar Enteritidis]
MLLQFSAAHGPEECCLAVKHALRLFLQEAAQSSVTVTIA